MKSKSEKFCQLKKIEGSDKLLRLQVDFNGENRQIIAGIGKVYEPESLVGKLCPFAYNLEPKELKGFLSQGMILCPSDSEGNPVLLCPDKDIPSGSVVK